MRPNTGLGGGLLNESVLLVRVQEAKNQRPIGSCELRFVLDPEPHPRPIHVGENFVFGHLQPLCLCRLKIATQAAELLKVGDPPAVPGWGGRVGDRLEPSSILD